MVIFAIALAPILALIIYFYHKDKYEKEPLSLLFKAYLGGFLITFLAILAELLLSWWINPIKVFALKICLKAFILAGLIEECSKFLVFKVLIYDSKEFNEPYDGILYAVMISLGFASLENILYISGAFLKLGFIGAMSVGIKRAIFAVPGHAFWSVMMGYYLGLAKFTKNIKFKKRYIYTGLGLAILAHALYDLFIFSKTPIGAIYMLIVFLISGKFALKAISSQAANSPFKT